MSMCSDSTLLVQPATVGNGGGNGNGMWGGDAWVLIILFALIFGWGNNGNGWGGNGGGTGAGTVIYDTGAGMQRGFDTSAIITKLDGINNGLCDGFYAMNTGLLNGFGGVNMNVVNGFANLATQLCQLGSSVALGQNGISREIADCCCDLREAISGVNYNMAMNSNAVQGAIRDGFCQTNYNAATNTRDIIEAQNANTRAIIDKLTAQEIAAKDAQIAAQNQRLFAAELASSQATQSQMLIDRLRPCPNPCYLTCNPWGGQAPYGSCTNYGGCGCGCN